MENFDSTQMTESERAVNFFLYCLKLNYFHSLLSLDLKENHQYMKIKETGTELLLPPVPVKYLVF